MASSTAPVIKVAGVHKRYDATVAMAEISFTVHPGEIFGLVGPNGAGKTTTVECLIGLRRPDRGRVRVLGLDPDRHGEEVRRRVGVQLQTAQLPPRLRVGEALTWFASFYPRTLDPEGLLEEWGLAGQRSTAFADLSGGQRQRLFLALALLSDPEVVCFDELSTGLDPRGRLETWGRVEALREEGRTVVLVTQDMGEAERLCDRVAIIDSGRVVAVGRPQALAHELGVVSLEDVFLGLTERPARGGEAP